MCLKTAPDKGENTMNDQGHSVEFDSLIILLTLTINFSPVINDIDILEHHGLIYSPLVLLCDDFCLM